MFENLDYELIAIQDNGILKCTKGQVINKKFTYLNSTANQLSLEVVSNNPAVVVIKTPVLIIESTGKDIIKF